MTTIKSGIYCIVHKLSGKRYVGSARDISVRWRSHRNGLRGGKHHSYKLQRAWAKHGEDAFLFRVVEYVADKAELLRREQFWIDTYKSASDKGYNVASVAGAPAGVKRSEEAKAKMRAAKLGVPRRPFTLETKEKMRLASLAKNQRLTEEQKSKMQTGLSRARAEDRVKIRGKAKPKWDTVGDFGL